MDTVLLTGISGYLGGHVALALLKRGFAVRGSLRDLAKADAVRTAIAAAGGAVDRLDFCALDLLNDAGWRDAARGCRYLQHVASPFVLKMPRDPDLLVRPAVEGTRRAIQAALAAGHERIVLTSSVAAIDSGHADYGRTLGPADWTRTDGSDVSAYTRSKTLAEREAWALMSHAGSRDRLSVVNPGTLIGPLIDDDPGTSVVVIQRMLRGDLPMLPDLYLPYVAVEDVAAVQVEAMLSPQACGLRHIVTHDAQPLAEIAAILRDRVPELARKVPRRTMPGWMAATVALFDRSLRDSRTYLGTMRRYDTSRTIALLGRPLQPTADAVAATARSLAARGLI